MTFRIQLLDLIIRSGTVGSLLSNDSGAFKLNLRLALAKRLLATSNYFGSMRGTLWFFNRHWNSIEIWICFYPNSNKVILSLCVWHESCSIVACATKWQLSFVLKSNISSINVLSNLNYDCIPIMKSTLVLLLVILVWFNWNNQEKAIQLILSLFVVRFKTNQCNSVKTKIENVLVFKVLENVFPFVAI